MNWKEFKERVDEQIDDECGEIDHADVEISYIDVGFDPNIEVEIIKDGSGTFQLRVL
tara:strand:+ start:1322 stop:1492 length:171 start_codon:yes stop_codon:yes gene_type:complete